MFIFSTDTFNKIMSVPYYPHPNAHHATPLNPKPLLPSQAVPSHQCMPDHHPIRCATTHLCCHLLADLWEVDGVDLVACHHGPCLDELGCERGGELHCHELGGEPAFASGLHNVSTGKRCGLAVAVVLAHSAVAARADDLYRPIMQHLQVQDGEYRDCQ